MASIEDIIWSDKVYSPLSLFTKYGHNLPLYVLLKNTFTTRNGDQTISAKQVARIDSVCEQKRVLIQDMTGQYYSAPEDYNRKFTIKEKRKIRKKTLKAILKHYTLPVPVSSEFPLLKQVRPPDGTTDDEDRKKFLILAVYPEKFFRMNIINEAGLIDSTVNLLPIYKAVDIQLAAGMKNSSKTSLSDMMKLYNCVVRKFNFSSVKGIPYVLMFTKEDIRNHTPPIIYDLTLPGMKHDDPPIKQKKRYSWRQESKTKIKNEIKVQAQAEDKTETETETETETIPTSREEIPVANGDLANGRVTVTVASSSQTDDEGSMLTDDVTSSGVSPRDSTTTKTSVGKPEQVTSPPIQTRIGTEPEGYFSETEAQRISRQELLSQKMYSSTGDLWRGAYSVENEPPPVLTIGDGRRRHRRIYRPRSVSMNHVDGIRHYGTTLLASGRVDRDFGFYGDSEKPATFRRRVPVAADSCGSPVGSWSGSWTSEGRRGLYRKRGDIAPPPYHTIHHVTNTTPAELPNGLRSAAIIKLRDVKPAAYSASMRGSRPDDVIVNFAPVQRSNSCSYDTSRGRTSPTLSIPLGHTRDISISTLTRSEGTRWRLVTDSDDDVFYSGRRQGAVLSPGEPLVEPEKDLELLHIEVQGAEKEWTLKREKAPRSPEQHSSGTGVSVQTSRELTERRVYEGSRSGPPRHQAREPRTRSREVDHGRIATSPRHGPGERKGKVRELYAVDDFELNGSGHGRREPKAMQRHDDVDLDVVSSRQVSRDVREEYSDGRPVRGRAEEDNVAYINARHGTLTDKHPEAAGGLHSHEREVFYDLQLVDRQHVTSARKPASERIEVKRTDLGGPATGSTLHVPLVDPTVDKRSHLLGSTSVDAHMFSTLPVAKSPGVATTHISRRFQYQPVQHRYRNRNHYYSSQGWNLITTGVGYEDVDGECQLDSVRSPGLEKFPDFVYDGSQLRDVHISYTDDSTSDGGGSTPTLTPARNSILGDNEGPGLENDDNGYDDRFETESHVQVIKVGEHDAGRDEVTTERQESSEIIVFTDSSGAVYDTGLTSMIESSRNEAMQELDRMTESSWNVDAKDDALEETTSGQVMAKQDDNNNITGFVGDNREEAGGADRESDSVSSISDSTSDEGAGSYQISGGENRASERSKTYYTATTSHSTTTEGSSNGASLQPGDVTLKSTENVKDVSREIRNAVVRANSVGSPDQKPDFRNELQAVLRLRSVSVEEGAREPEANESPQPSPASSVSVSDHLEADAKMRSGQGITTRETLQQPSEVRQESPVTITRSSGTTHATVERHQTTSSAEIRTSSMTDLLSGVAAQTAAHDPAMDRTVDELVRTGSVSSLRQVYKTPPSSRRQKKTLSVAESSEVFANSANDVRRDSPTAGRIRNGATKSGSGKFVMRFREGDGSASTQSPTSEQSDAFGTRINQDMSLPANEEVQFLEGGGYQDSERYSMHQSDDTLSQSSYSSSKLEHFNFGLSNFQSNF